MYVGGAGTHGFLHETASVIMAGLINMTHMETPALTNGANTQIIEPYYT